MQSGGSEITCKIDFMESGRNSSSIQNFNRNLNIDQSRFIIHIKGGRDIVTLLWFCELTNICMYPSVCACVRHTFTLLTQYRVNLQPMWESSSKADHDERMNPIDFRGQGHWQMLGCWTLCCLSYNVVSMVQTLVTKTTYTCSDFSRCTHPCTGFRNISSVFQTEQFRYWSVY